MVQFSPLRTHSPTNSRDSGHSSDTPNGILSPTGRHEGLLRPFGRLPDNSDMGEYVSVFSPNGSSTGTIPRVYHRRSGSSIYEDMDRRVSKSKFRPLNALMPLEIDAAIVHAPPRTSRSPVKANGNDGPNGGPHFPLETDGRNPPPKPTNRAAKQPPPLAAKPAPAPRSHSTASSTMGGSMSGGASVEIQTLTLDAEEITRLAEKQVAARKRSRDSLIGDEEEEEDGFQRSAADRRRPSESEDSAVPQETASLSPTSSSGDASSQENGKRWNPAPVDIAKWRPTAPFAVDNRPKTGWQQIKADQELRKVAHEGAEEEDDALEKPAPRKKVNQLIKQFAQLDTGEIPLPQNPVPKPPRPAMRACFSSTFQMSASLYAPKSPLNGPTRSLEASLYSHRDRSASPLRQTAFGFVSHAEVHKTMSSPPTSPIATEPRRELLVSPSAPRRVLEPMEQRKAAPTPVASLDFKKFDVSEKDVIGRPARSRTSSSESDTDNKVSSGKGKTAGLLSHDEEAKRSHVEEKPTKEQLEEIRVLLRNDYANYSLFCVNLQRDAGVEDGSVGLILTSTMSAFDSFITVQRVITGSIADRDGRLCKGDRIFFIQGKPTEKMSASEARSLMKSPAAVVKLVVGRPLLQGYSSMTLSSTASDANAMFTEDPATQRYEQKPIVVTLVKSDLGVGFSMDGGRGSKYGDRPIVVKKVFAAGEAARNGQVSIGDEIRSIDGIQLSGMTHLEAWKTLKSMREGPLEFVVYKRIVE
ncbi:interleukin-16 [Aphelenchoides avenae]|nr:interleukin-16 [Aphelenchus avenae]